MSACLNDDTLQRYLEGGLPDEQAGAIEGHLSLCPNCRSALDRVSGASQLPHWAGPGGLPPTPLPDDSALDRLMDKLQALDPAGLSGAPDAVTVPEEDKRLLAPPQHDGDLGMLGPYRVLRELGHGGMGVVFLGHDPKLDRPVALKVIRLTQSDTELRGWFQREAWATARLEHEHVVTVHAVETTPDGHPYLVMQYVDGPTLRARIKAEGKLVPKEAARIGQQVAQGLAAAHAKGLVHRDIKPANILLDQATGRAKITDFGLVRVTARPSEATLTGGPLGTPAYMSPEQVVAPERADQRSDVYSLGAVLYEALTGQLPVAEPRSPRKLNPKVARDLETICLKCLEKELARRYASAEELADDLQRWLQGETIRAWPVRPWVRSWRWCRRNPRLGALIILLVLVGFVAEGIHWRWQESRATAFHNTGAYYSEKREYLKAAEQFEKEAPIWRRLIGRYPTHRTYQERLEECCSNLLQLYVKSGTQYQDQNKLKEAVKYYEMARTIWKHEMKKQRPKALGALALGKGCQTCGYFHFKNGNLDEARACFADAILLFEGVLVSEFQEDQEAGNFLAHAYFQRAEVQVRIADKANQVPPHKALDDLEKAIRLRPEHWSWIVFRLGVHARFSDYREKVHAQAVQLYKKVKGQGLDLYNLACAYAVAANSFHATQEGKRAEEHINRAFDLLAEAFEVKGFNTEENCKTLENDRDFAFLREGNYKAMFDDFLKLLAARRGVTKP